MGRRGRGEAVEREIVGDDCEVVREARGPVGTMGGPVEVVGVMGVDFWMATESDSGDGECGRERK